MPKISILTPCYRSEKYVGRTIESVQFQTLADWEHIVVDDGSPDTSASVVAGYAAAEPRLRLVRQRNGGVAKARNAAYRHAADSEYLLFLDADDCLEPTMLAEMTAYLDARPEVGMVYCAPAFIGENDAPLTAAPSEFGWSPRYVPRGPGLAKLPDEEPETPFCSLFALTTVIPSISVMRRSVYEQTPGWDENFGHVYEDLDLFLQFALHSKVHRLNKPLVRYRRHTNQSTANIARVHAQEAKLYAKWEVLTPTLPPEQRGVVEAAKRFRERRMIPLSGVRGGIASWRNGERGKALRFWLGAGRRYLGSSLSSSPAERKTA